MEVVGEYVRDEDEGEDEKGMEGGGVVLWMRERRVIEVLVWNMENWGIVEEVIERYVEEEGNGRGVKVKDGNEGCEEWGKYM